jgi:outer membrane lipoprotein LolB
MRANSPKGPENPDKSGTSDRSEYTGRISLVIHTEAVQSFSGGFELSGNAAQGELTLITPLGQTAAQLSWGAGFARLKTGQSDSEVRSYPSKP